jgi:hypothetical protein
MTEYGPVDPSQYPDILERAADILESEKVPWCKGSYFNDGQLDAETIMSACALGALRLAMMEESHWNLEDMRRAPRWLTDTEIKIDAIICTHVGVELDIDSVATFNDWPGTTRDEVVELLKQVAKGLRNDADEPVL